MTTVSIFGNGNMGTAIGGIVADGGADVQYLGRDAASIDGDIVVLAVPYPEVAGIIAAHGTALAGKVVVDITNPLDFTTFDSLVVPADSSAAAEIATALPDSRVLKAFNTNFAATLVSKTVGGVPTTVLVAGDDADAKQSLASVVEAGGLAVVDAGALSRARELESLGFLQLTLAVQERIGWTEGFAVAKESALV
ncbi:dinucleotide-binding protein [Agromyces rhizosphaerae]|uniref:Dinucleotide-binding protein n=1 Tax=Agromyces rhizosphaerae TaxID=88374 RepID=A0A9W6CW39_9MICO|nr:NADPH-dependent F420 reductase [Agromyces rhizosphaerae]GLI26317.1 dinucleotide-binding protein [Agromyces rhizosphaerae]